MNYSEAESQKPFYMHDFSRNPSCRNGNYSITGVNVKLIYILIKHHSGAFITPGPMDAKDTSGEAHRIR